MPPAARNISIWIEAARPKTLAAAFVPVLVGAAVAWHHGLLRWDATAVALFCAFAIQIGTNFANDYFDYIKGADTNERVGFARATATGLLSSRAMLTATIACMATAFLAGLYLVWIGGWVVLAIGLLSILFGILYTGGPFPLGYNGLGDLFVFIFFGIVAVAGTYYVNALQWSVESVVAAVPVGALAVAILIVNNLRDVHQDRKANKRTLGVLFGETFLKAEYLAMIILTLPPLFILHLLFGWSGWVFLPMLSLPWFIILSYDVLFHNDKPMLNKTLEQTAKAMALFGILFAVGIVFS
ncbi:MAG: 1,4-dihydroxy-2-naphthoate polyprenyltransferase [Balneolaceae bacterium]